MQTYTLGILVFDDVEVLDFCGPFEVFSVTRIEGTTPFRVLTIAETSPITTRGGLSVNPSHTLEDAPPLDILLVPGGQGTRKQIHNDRLCNWIGEKAREVELLLSVCSGALLLAKAGLLDGKKATTHHLALHELEALVTTTQILPDERVVDNGNVILSAGISAGIDMSLHVVSRLLGKDVAQGTAAHMEYAWNHGEGVDSV